MADNITTLKTNLQNTGNYTKLTDAQIQAAAQQRVNDIYQNRQDSTQQMYAAADAAKAAQLGDLIDRYARNEQLTQSQYAEGMNRIGEQVRSRGMQRGNYNNELTAYMGKLEGEALGKVLADRELAAGNVQDERELMARQLADQMTLFNRSKATDIAAYADELGAREYDRGVTAQKIDNSVMQKLYDYEHQLEVEAEDRRRWEEEMAFKRAQLDASSSGGRGGRGSGSGSGSDKTPYQLWLEGLTSYEKPVPVGYKNNLNSAKYTDR